MTLFAQLGFLEKSAYQQGPTGLNDVWARPQATAAPAPTTSPAKGGWGWKDTGELAADIGLGWNPFTGVPWFGGKALYQQGHAVWDGSQALKNALQGNWSGAWDSGKQALGHWGNALANVGFGALSFLPGGGSAGAAAKAGIKGGTKLIPALFKAGPKAWTVGKMLPKGVRTGLGVGGTALGFGAGPAVNWMTGQSGQGQPQIPESYTPQPPAGAMSLPEQMSRSLIANKPV